MKWSKASSHALCGVTAVSALSLPSTNSKRAGEVSTLPLEQFGWFDTLSLEDAKSGIVKSHNGSLHKIVTEVLEDIGGVASAIADTLHLLPGGSSSDAKISTVDTANDVDTVSAAAVTCTNPNIRFEWRDYSDTDRHAFVAAYQCLLKAPASGNFPPAQNRYEDLVRVHQMMTDTIHGNNIFLFWHRYYVWTLEQIMRDECGFDRAFPWWDETLDAGAFAASSIFTADFFGTLPGATNGQGTCVTDGVSKIKSS
jgi:tyrosinase